MTTSRTSLLLPAALLLSSLAAAQSVLERSDLEAPPQQWRLPDKLNEISGLALTDDRRLLAITDETAIVYELDYGEGRLVKAFALGEPTEKGDFEGIAWFEGRVWLTTSRGRIYEAGEGADGERVPFRDYETGLGDACEIEGLAFRQPDRMLLLLCKKIKKKSGLGSLMIFAWSTETRELVPAKNIALPDRDIARALRMNRLNPSGIAIGEQSGNLVIVAARQHAVIELGPDGSFIAAKTLNAERHRQSEGIEILPSGDLLVADEGGEHRARLAVYAAAR